MEANKSKNLQARDYMSNLISDLSQQGIDKIYFNALINAIFSCKDIFPIIAKETRIEDVKKALDEMSYYQEIKFGSDEKGLFFIPEENMSKNSNGNIVLEANFKDFSETVGKIISVEQGL